MENRLNEAIRKVREDRHKARRYTALLLVLAMMTSMFVSWDLRQVGVALTDSVYSCGLVEHTHNESCYTRELICGYTEGEIIGTDTTADSTASKTEPASSETVASKSEETTPASSETAVSKSEETKPASSETAASKSEETTPASSETAASESTGTDSVESESTASDSVASESAASETTGTESSSTELETTETESAASSEAQADHSYDSYDDYYNNAASEELTYAPLTMVGENSIDELDSSEVQVHHHTDACYKKVLTCGMVEHTHTAACLADTTADLESEADWEQYKQDSESVWTEALVKVAQAQLDYTESEKNFVVDEALGETLEDAHHYTRYGAWYGNEYGKWDFMFVAFCQHYAGIPEDSIPGRAALDALLADMKNSKYLEDDGADAMYGDIVTYYNSDNEETIGIVVDDTDEDTIKVISGDVEGKVAEVTVNLTDVTHTILVDYAYAEYKGIAGDYAIMTTEETTTTVDDFNKDIVQFDSNDITGLTGGKLTYSTQDDNYKVNLQFDFKIDRSKFDADKTYELKLGEDVTVPNDLLSKVYTLTESEGSTTKTGNYIFVQNSNGTYSIRIRFDKNHFTTTTGSVTGCVSFFGTAKAKEVKDDGSIIIAGSDGVEINVEGEKIIFPDDETNRYQLSTWKEASKVEDGKLKYTVTVSSTKGTPDVVCLSDKVTSTGDLTLKQATGVVVTKQTITQIKDNNGSWNDNGSPTEETLSNGSYSYTISDKKIDMTLPKMETAVSADGSSRTITRYKVTYVYEVDGDIPRGSYEIKNKVNTYSEKDGTKVSKDAEHTIKIDNNYKIEKSGWFDENSNCIKWTIKVNSDHQNIAGSYLTDTMFKKITKESLNVTVRDKSGNKVTGTEGWNCEVDTNGKLTKITFESTDAEKKTNTYSYEFTYTTPAERKSEKQEVKNDWAFYPEGDKEGITGTGSAWINASVKNFWKNTDGEATKTENGTYVMPWKVGINFEAKTLKTGTKFEDTTLNGNGGSHGMTKAQVKAWGGTYTWSNGQTDGANNTFANTTYYTFKLIGSDSQEYSYANIDSVSENITFTGYRIEVIKDLTLPTQNGSANIEFSYATTAESNQLVENTSFKNTFKFNGDEQTAEFTYKEPKIVKMDGNDKTVSIDTKTGDLVWKIKVTTDKNYSTITVEDTLPEGVEFKSVKTQYWPEIPETSANNGTISATGKNNVILTGTYDADTRKLVLTLQKNESNGTMNAQDYTLVITAKVVKNPDGNPLETGKTYTYSNTATLKVGRWSIDSNKQTQEWEKTSDTEIEGRINKSGSYNYDQGSNDMKLSYHIDLNPDGAVIGDTSVKYLTLKDVLEINAHPTELVGSNTRYDVTSVDVTASLDTASVKLYYASRNEDGTLQRDENGKLIAGTEVLGYTWTLDTSTVSSKNHHTLTMEKIPNGEPLVLEYVYRVTTNASAVHSTKMDIIKIGEVKNQAELVGVVKSDTITSSELQWSDSGTSGSAGSTRSLTLVKTEQGNYGKLLPNAMFTLEKRKSDGSYAAVKESDGSDVTLTTNTDGKISITEAQTKSDKGTTVTFEKDVLYRLVETKAPDGYEIPSEQVPVYFYFSSNGTTVAEGAQNLNAADLTKESKTVYVGNTPNNTEVSVRKLWRNTEGKDITPTVSSIEVALHQVAYSTTPSSTTSGMASISFEKAMYDNTISMRGDLAVVCPVGTTFTVQAKFVASSQYNSPVSNLIVTWDGVQQDGTQQEGLDSENRKTITYTYTLTMTEGTHELKGCASGLWNAVGMTWTVTKDDSGAGSSSGGDAAVITTERNYRTATLTTTDNWQHTFTNLPLKKTNEDGTVTYYAYYVEETKVDGTAVADGRAGSWIVTQDTTPVTSGTLTIVNTEPTTEDSPYELPSTGSTGTAPYTACGALMMGAAVMYGYHSKRKRGRRAE